ncbi:hypothetical protein BDW62DRAFT_171434 [Aspergillus aurantiobrunneus]
MCRSRLLGIFTSKSSTKGVGNPQRRRSSRSIEWPLRLGTIPESLGPEVPLDKIPHKRDNLGKFTLIWYNLQLILQASGPKRRPHRTDSSDEEVSDEPGTDKDEDDDSGDDTAKMANTRMKR